MFEGSKFCSINRAKPRPTDNHDTMCAGWQGTQLSVNSNSHEISQSPFSLSGLSLPFPVGSGGWRSSILPPTHVYSQASCILLLDDSHVFCSFNEKFSSKNAIFWQQKVHRTFSNIIEQWLRFILEPRMDLTY